MMRGESVTRGALAGSSAGFIGSTLLNELDALSEMREGIEGGAPRSISRWEVGALSFADALRAQHAQDDAGLDSYETLLQRYGNGAAQTRTSEQLISSLPTQRRGAGSVTGDSANTCSVCLGSLEEDEVKTLPCLHVFHTGCIDPWLRQSVLCPTCKTSVTEEGGTT
jgi:hypothetical protein